MPYKTVIFDLDGTLLNTLADIADAVNRTLNTRGFPTHDEEAYRFFVGDGSRMLIKRALPEKKRSDASIEGSLNAFKQDYAKAWDVKTAPYKGIAELLDCLVQANVRMAVCSNKPHAFTILCVEKLLKKWRFDPIVGQRACYPKKPAPDSALAIARDMGISPSEVLFVGRRQLPRACCRLVLPGGSGRRGNFWKTAAVFWRVVRVIFCSFSFSGDIAICKELQPIITI